MDHQYIEDNNLIERYVLGRLPVEEQVRFEEHFAECDECIAELELADDFGGALRAAVAEDARTAAAAGFAAVLARWLSGPRAAVLMAALVAVAVLPSVWLVSENRQLAGDLESLRRPQAKVPSFLLTLVRDTAAAPAPVISVPAGQPWLTLAIESDEGVASYDATLRDGEGRIRWREEGLEPNLWGVLQMTFPVDLLPAGDYRLELEGRDDAGRREPVGTYPFIIASP